MTSACRRNLARGLAMVMAPSRVRTTATATLIRKTLKILILTTYSVRRILAVDCETSTAPITLPLVSGIGIVQ